MTAPVLMPSIDEMSARLGDALDAAELSEPVRVSALKYMALSPAHYRHQVLHGKEQTLSMRLGDGGHSLLLGRKPVTVYPGRRAGKEWDAFEAAHPGHVILNEREHDVARGMSDAVLRHKEAAELLLDGTVVESPIDWSFLGRKCRSTPDAYNRDKIVELKTCRTAQPERFMKQALWQYYHAQLAFYAMAVRFSIDVPCYIVAVESAPPHPVQVFRLSPKTLDKGWQLCRAWFERLLVCEEANVWPGYTEAVTTWDVDDDPDWLVFADEKGDEP